MVRSWAGQAPPGVAGHGLSEVGGMVVRVGQLEASALSWDSCLRKEAADQDRQEAAPGSS